MNTRTLDVLTVLGVFCAALTTGLVIKREVVQPGTAADAQSSGPSPVDDWEQYIASGRLLGSESAPLKIVEFADFQCPACRSLHQLFSRLRQQRPNDFAISYHYVPLSYHAQAYPAARAAECAADQGRFEQYHDGLFAHFDSLNQDGAFMRIARTAQVPDLPRFQECMTAKIVWTESMLTPRLPWRS